jgi:transposase
MRRFLEGADRSQSTLFPECLEDSIDEDNPVRVIDVFVDELDLRPISVPTTPISAAVQNTSAS